jgi:hypothetical protein
MNGQKACSTGHREMHNIKKAHKLRASARARNTRLSGVKGLLATDRQIHRQTDKQTRAACSCEHGWTRGDTCGIQDLRGPLLSPIHTPFGPRRCPQPTLYLAPHFPQPTLHLPGLGLDPHSTLVFRIERSESRSMAPLAPASVRPHTEAQLASHPQTPSTRTCFRCQ